jgi:4'-phosphopantetheinyl transferase EntD
MRGSAFDGMLPPGAVAVEANDPSWWEKGLLPEELVHITRATEKRRREFSAGRNCARAALVKLGLPAMAIPMGPRRQPLFPATVVGSITHTGDYCVAAVVRQGVVCSLGIDAEADVPMEEAVVRRVLGEEERNALQRYAYLGNVDVLAFGLKEAFYKAAFPICQRYIDFEEVAIRLSDTVCRIELLAPTFVEELAAVNIDACFRFADQRVYCAVVLTHGLQPTLLDALAPPATFSTQVAGLPPRDSSTMATHDDD